MRVKTIKRLAILVAVLGVVSGTAVLGWTWQITRMVRSKAHEAENAAKKGDFATAERLYQEHLALVPDDVDVEIALADSLANSGGSIARRTDAMQLYRNLLKLPGRDDVRRKLARLQMKTGYLIEEGGAEFNLKLLLNKPQNANDGELLFWMGRCAEAGKNYAEAEKSYKLATTADTPPEIRIEAYRRLASVLQNKEVNKPEEADKAIESMVQSDPTNYKVYLERTRYRREVYLNRLRDRRTVNLQVGEADLKKAEADLKKSVADLDKAMELADREPEVYLEQAQGVTPELPDDATALERKQDREARQIRAREILEAGLKKSPSSIALYRALHQLDLQSGHLDQAIATLERGLSASAATSETPQHGLKSDESVNRNEMLYQLASLLAHRGETGKLLLRIKELETTGVPPTYMSYLNAFYNVNIKDFAKAREILVPIDSQAHLPSDFKARVKDLLARCYGKLGDPTKQEDALRQARVVNPQDAAATLGLIDVMIKKGDIDGAINEYKTIAKLSPERLSPQHRLQLAQLMIARNRQRPAPQRDWTEVSSLIDDLAKALPDSIQPLIARAELYMAQEKPAEAQAILEKSRTRFSKDVVIWSAEASLLAAQKKFDAALNVLDEAKKQLGDKVEIRLQRAKFGVAKGGPRVAADLKDLGQNIDAFSKEERTKLLNGLAELCDQVQDTEGATHFWSLLADQEPNNLDWRLHVLQLAFQTADKEAIEKNIKLVKDIEGNDPSMGRFCEINYLIWQAQRAVDTDPQEALRLRTKARSDLSDLEARRPDWSVIPRTMARLEQQELAQTGLKEDEIRAKEENIIRYYQKAIDLGEHSSVVIRETVQRLFKNKQGKEAIELLNKIPLDSQLAVDLGRRAQQFAMEQRDFKGAEEIARKSIAANPTDFIDRIWLVHVLFQSGKPEDALTELQTAVNLAPTEPNRWLALVQGLVMTKQPEKAETAIKQAETALPPAVAPLALAHCCESMMQAYESPNEVAIKKWSEAARKWYQKAQAAKPKDISIARDLATFFLKTKQFPDAKAQLDVILKWDAGARSDETTAWARRTKALILAASSDPQEVRGALALLEPSGPAANGQTALQDPDDLRALAQVLNAQKTPQDRLRAIAILQSLVAKNIAKPDDRFLLAQLYESSGNWDQGREEYRGLNAKTRNARDLEVWNRRPQYLVQFAKSLLGHHQAGDDQTLSEVQDLVDELKQIQPNVLSTLELQVALFRLRNQLAKAVDVISEVAEKPNLSPMALKVLGQLAESVGGLDLAGQLYKKYADLDNSPAAKYPLIIFLAKHDRLKEALDIYEPLFANERDMDLLARTCVDVVVSSPKYDAAQVERAAGWLEKALKAAEAQNRNSTSSTLLCDLGNIREQQKRYPDAENFYKRAIDKGGNPVAYNNLAWLMALHHDGTLKDALAYVERAIALKGPLFDCLDTRGVIYLLLNRPDKAISDLEMAVNAAPSPARLFHLAQAYMQNKEQEKAKQALQNAKTKGLPSGLHALEMPAYKKLLDDLEPQ